jgi:hypothetical protein
MCKFLIFPSVINNHAFSFHYRCLYWHVAPNTRASIRQWLTRKYSGRTIWPIAQPTHLHFDSVHLHITHKIPTLGKLRTTLGQEPEFHLRNWRNSSSMSSCLIQMRVMSILLLRDFVSWVSRKSLLLSCKRPPKRYVFF